MEGKFSPMDTGGKDIFGARAGGTDITPADASRANTRLAVDAGQVARDELERSLKATGGKPKTPAEIQAILDALK